MKPLFESIDTVGICYLEALFFVWNAAHDRDSDLIRATISVERQIVIFKCKP